MKIVELMQKQKELDDFIIENKNLQNKGNRDMINALSCAFYSELLEVRNELDTAHLLQHTLLMEYIDCLHFLLAIGYRIGMDTSIGLVEPYEVPTTYKNLERYGYVELLTDMTIRFTELMDGIRAFKFWSDKESESTYILTMKYLRVWDTLWASMRKIGYSDDEITKAYDDKYQENIRRQEEGY